MLYLIWYWSMLVFTWWARKKWLKLLLMFYWIHSIVNCPMFRCSGSWSSCNSTYCWTCLCGVYTMKATAKNSKPMQIFFTICPGWWVFLENVWTEAYQRFSSSEVQARPQRGGRILWDIHLMLHEVYVSQDSI